MADQGGAARPLASALLRNGAQRLQDSLQDPKEARRHVNEAHENCLDEFRMEVVDVTLNLPGDLLIGLRAEPVFTFR